MKRFISISVALTLSALVVAPATAYFMPSNSQMAERSSRRHIVRQADTTNRRAAYIPYAERTRRRTEEVESGHSLLRRATGRRHRRFNRSRKPGQDRYRVLNIRRLRPNKRSLNRQQMEMMDSEASLPATLVQTGLKSNYDRPTRRDIRENHMFNQISGRDRNILLEIQNSSR